MKKLFAIFMLCMSFIMVNAQNLESSSLRDNWFVGANVGAIAPVDHSFDFANHSGLKAYRSEVGVEVGRWITPVIGLGATGEFQINTTGSKTAFDAGTYLGDLHVNLSNLFAGYKGAPRTWEFEAIPSIGVIHYYGDVTGPHRFYAMGRAALSANYNFGKHKEWTAYVRPGIQYADRFRHYNGQFDVRIGVTYKFKNKNKTHSFTYSPYTVTQADYDAALAKATKEPQVVTNVVEKTINVPTLIGDTRIVTFGFNSSELSPNAKQILDAIPTNVKVALDAYASPEGTEKYNMNLSAQRAEVVKTYLMRRGINVVNVDCHGAENDYSNRIVIVKVSL